MKIIAQYTSRVKAEEDSNYLMTRGIAAVIYGDAAPKCLIDHFKSEPIALAVQDIQSERAKELLISRKDKDIIIEIPKWLAKQAKRGKSENL